MKLPFKLPFKLPKAPIRIPNWKTPWKIQRITEEGIAGGGEEAPPEIRNPSPEMGGESILPEGEGAAPAQPVADKKPKKSSPFRGIAAAALLVGLSLGIYGGVQYYAHWKEAEEAAMLEAVERAKGPTREEVIAEYQAHIREKVGPILEKGNPELADFEIPQEGTPAEVVIATETVRIKFLDGQIKVLRRMKVPEGYYDYHSEILKGLEGLKGGSEYLVSGLQNSDLDKLLHGFGLREDAWKTLFKAYQGLMDAKPHQEPPPGQVRTLIPATHP